MYKKFYYILLFCIITLILSACLTTTRLAKTSKKYAPTNNESSSVLINVLLTEQGFNLPYTVEGSVILYKNEKAIAVVKNMNVLNFSINGKGLKLKIADSVYEASYFKLKPAEEEDPVSYRGKNYRGIIKICERREHNKSNKSIAA